MQVDPIRSTLKPPGLKRLKVQHDELLSTFTFKINLRRYSTGSSIGSSVLSLPAFNPAALPAWAASPAPPPAAAAAAASASSGTATATTATAGTGATSDRSSQGRAVQVDPIKTHVEIAWN